MEIINRISILLAGREQKELTNYLGLKSVAFSEWKSGKSKSYRKYLIEIAEFFNVSLDYLVYGKENQNTMLTTDEQELLENYRHLAPDIKEETSKRVQELTTQNTSTKEHSIEPVIQHSNASNINIYEQDLLRSFRDLPFGEQMKIIGKVETLAEIFKSEENVG